MELTHILAVSGSNAVASVLVEFGLLLFGLGILARLAAKVGLSPVPLYLIVGLFFGVGGVFPLDFNEDFVRIAAEIGAIMLLLMLGLEFSGQELMSTARQQWHNGFIDIGLNATPGVVAGLLLGWGALGAVALGGITYISSSGIVAQLIRDLQIKKKREVPAVIGLLIMEDLAMAPYLPVVTTLATGVSLMAGLISVATALVVVALVFAISLRRKSVANKLLNAEQPTALMLTLFGAAIAVSGLAIFVNFSSAVAAFLVGMLFTDEVALTARKRLSPLRDLFASVFFVFLGLNTNPREIPSVLWVAIALTVVGVITKILTGRLVARSAGAGETGMLRAGTLLVARGEFSVVIAGIVAVSLNSSSSLLALTTTYVLFTAIVGPVLARLVEPMARYWRKRRARLAISQ